MDRSETLIEMLDTRKGYRCESYSNGRPGWRPLRDILDFEVVGLCNEDVIKGICQEIGLDCGDSEGWLDDPAEVAENLIYGVEQKLGEGVQALWLTSKQGANAHYCQAGEAPDEYVIPRNAIPVSDLDDDGTLFLKQPLLHPLWSPGTTPLVPGKDSLFRGTTSKFVKPGKLLSHKEKGCSILGTEDYDGRYPDCVTRIYFSEGDEDAEGYASIISEHHGGNPILVEVELTEELASRLKPGLEGLGEWYVEAEELTIPFKKRRAKAEDY